MTMDDGADPVARRLTIGNVAVALLYDGAIRIAPEVILPAERRQEWPPLALDDEGIWECPVSCLLVWSKAGLVLVDTGNGMLSHKKFSGGGELVHNLRASGIEPESVAFVVITHAHGDHFGGVMSVTGRETAPSFPNARYLMSSREWGHVRDQAEQMPHVAECLLPLERQGLLELVEMDAQIAPEIVLRPAYGHTPGQFAVQVLGSDAGLLFLGDVVHHLGQIANPDLVSTGDYDRLAVPATRRQLFDLAVRDDLIVCGSHFTFPDAFSLRRAGTGYATRLV